MIFQSHYLFLIQSFCLNATAGKNTSPIWEILTLDYYFLGFKLPKAVNGAWIGGCIDGTGNVAVSAEMMDNESIQETAIVIKMCQNILIGFVCAYLVIFTLYYIQGSFSRPKIVLDAL